MNEEKLYHQAEKIKYLIYEIESLAKVLNIFMIENEEKIEYKDLIILSDIIRQKTLTASKMCRNYTCQIEQFY